MRSIRVLATTSLLAIAGAFLLGPPQAGAIEVYDAKMQHLGMLLDIHSAKPDSTETTALKLYLHNEERSIQLNVSSGELTLVPLTLYYTDADCDSIAYVNETMFYSIAKFNSKNKFAITAAVESPAEVVVRGQRGDLFFSTAKGCREVKPQTMMLVPATQVSLPFTLPVTLPLIFQDVRLSPQ